MEPESLILLGGGLWLGAALITGLPYRRVPSAFPALFSVFAAMGALVGLSESVPEFVDEIFTLTAAVLFVLTPIACVVYLLHEYPPESPPPKPREIGD